MTTLAAIADALLAAPLAFLVGLLAGLWIGGHYTIRKHGDGP